MKKMKLVIGLTLMGILALPFTAAPQEQKHTTEKMGKEKTEQGSSMVQSQTAPVAASKFEFLPLPYAYDALEPYIDKLTMEIHYSKHHRAYYDNFINAIKGTEMETMDIKDIFKSINKYPVAVRNNSGGYFNHTLYWENMKPQGGGAPTGKLSEAIIKNFGSFDDFKKQLTEAGKARFGSGWAWLCLGANGSLFICSTPNQDNPLMEKAEKPGIPLIALDVWEHAYYLKFQNKRADYIEAFWKVINWDEVAKRYDAGEMSMNTK